MSMNNDALLAAFVSGASPDQMEAAAYGKDAVQPASTEDNSSEEVSSQVESEVDNFFTNEEESASDSSSQSDEEQPAETKVDSDVEELVAGGKKIQINYKDRAAIKDAYLKAAGMRKFQRERDQERASKKELQSKIAEHESLWEKVETAAARNDYNELMRIMTGGKTDFDTVLNTRLERARLRADASEEDQVKFDQEDKISQLEATVNRQSQELEKLLNKVKAEKEEVVAKSVQSRVEPVFNKYRFAGKLGNSAAEHKLDRMIWNDALSSLEELGLDEGDLTPEIIEREFKSAAEVLGQVTKKMTQKETQNVTQQRKREAQEAAQLQQVRGYLGSNVKKEAAEKIRSGDLTSIFKNWGKYKDVF